MDSENRKRISNKENNSDANAELPFDIIVNIIVRLPVMLILGCKSLSRAFKNFISDPLFDHLYRTTNPNSLCTIFVDRLKAVELLESDIRDIDYDHANKMVAIFQPDRLFVDKCTIVQRWAYCNGLLCFWRLNYGSYDFFVTNPILGEFIQRPESLYYGRKYAYCYGLGYCQFTDKYKVLAVCTDFLDSSDRGRTDIFTIGSDRNWRSISEVKEVFYGFKSSSSIMVPLRSDLHWLMYRHPQAQAINIEGKNMVLCAFDMTEEKARALPVPPQLRKSHALNCLLSVIADKICVWLHSCDVLRLWVMDDYGVEGSWTMHLLLQSGLHHIYWRDRWSWILLTVSPGVIMVSIDNTLLLYDMKKKEWRRAIHREERESYPIPFVPTFVSLRNLVPELILDVHP